MAKKLYVGGIPYAATEQEVEEEFAKHGEVSSVSFIRDKFSGQFRGFGFVEMPDDAQAEQAIEALNGFNFKGRQLIVNEARPQEPRPPRSGGFGGGGRRSDQGNRGFGGGGRNKRDRW